MGTKKNFMRELTKKEQSLSARYFNMFHSFFTKRLKIDCGIPFVDMENAKIDSIYSWAIKGYLKSIVNFNYEGNTSEELYDTLNSDNPDKELERKFINYMYNNVKFYIWNYYTKDNKKKEKVQFVSFDQLATESYSYKMDEVIERIEDYFMTERKIEIFSKDDNVQKEYRLSKKQIEGLLKSFFTKENFKFLNTSDRITTHSIKPLIEDVFEKNKQNKYGINKNNINTFRSKFYKLIRNFIHYEYVNVNVD